MIVVPTCLQVKEQEELASPKYSLCCSKGKDKIPIPTVPEEFRQIVKSPNFSSLSRIYNTSLAFASLGIKVDASMVGNGPYTFKIQGGIYHSIGPVMPGTQFAQVLSN
jgi:hypothetical protein